MKYFSTRYINASNLIYNYKLLCQKSGHKIIAVLKANAYGHGAKIIMKILDKYCDFYATENLEEALELKKLNQTKKVLILGYCIDFNKAIKNDICVTCDNISQLKQIAKLDKKIKIHLKINTGMNRLGIKSRRQFVKILKYIKKNPQIILDGVFTHCFDCQNKDITYAQIEIFKKYLKILQKFNFKDVIVHMGGSGLINYKLDFVDYIRSGIALYGYQFSGTKKVQTIKSQILKITGVKKGEFVGYGETKVKKNLKVAVVPLGYADGIPRNFENLYVLYKKHKLNVVGRLCMDMFMVDVTHVKIKVFDEVKVFFNASIWAKNTKDTEYDILTRLNNCRANVVTIVEKNDKV